MKKVFYFFAVACFVMACNNVASNKENETAISNSTITTTANIDMPDLNKPEDIAMDFKKAIFAGDYVAAKKIFLPTRYDDLKEIEAYWSKYVDLSDIETFVSLVNRGQCFINEQNKNKAYCVICCDAEAGREVIHVEKLDRTWYVSMSVKDFDHNLQYQYLEKTPSF